EAAGEQRRQRLAFELGHVAGQVHVESRSKRISIVEFNTGYFQWVHGPFLWSARAIFARVTPNYMPVVYLRIRVATEADEVEVKDGAGKLSPSELRRNMKRLVFGIAVAATLYTAPLAHADPDVQGQCASSGGQY